MAILEFLCPGTLDPDDTWTEVLSQIGIQLGRSYESDWSQRQMREAERKALESQKLEAVGRLAGGIAHDFNNLLMVVLGEAELALRDDHLSGALRSSLEEIRSSGKRAAALTAQLLAFSRRDIVSPERIDLGELVRNSERMLRRVIGENIRLVTEGVDDAEGCFVRVARGLMDQVVMNLVVNAREAMPNGGTITMRLGVEELPASTATGIAGVEPGPHAVLSVSDTGVGIPDEIRESLFEPFFTTKPDGSGFGLSTSYGIVSSAGGLIEVDSEVGAGSEFRVWLPLAEDVDPAAEEADAPEPAPHASVRVLIVEDDDGVRSVAIRILEAAGYDVVAARGGDQVREHLGEATRPDVLLTDCVLENETGRDIDALVRETVPDVATVFMSGYTDDVLLRHGVRPRGSEFLAKPFSPEALIAVVERARSENPGRAAPPARILQRPSNRDET